MALRDIRFAAADRRRDLGIGAARLLLQFHDVAIDVVGRHRAATRNSARKNQRSNRGCNPQFAKRVSHEIPSGVEYLSPKSKHAHDIINRSVFTSCEIGAAGFRRLRA